MSAMSPYMHHVNAALRAGAPSSAATLRVGLRRARTRAARPAYTPTPRPTHTPSGLQRCALEREARAVVAYQRRDYSTRTAPSAAAAAVTPTVAAPLAWGWATPPAHADAGADAGAGAESVEACGASYSYELAFEQKFRDAEHDVGLMRVKVQTRDTHETVAHITACLQVRCKTNMNSSDARLPAETTECSWPRL